MRKAFHLTVAYLLTLGIGSALFIVLCRTNLLRTERVLFNRELIILLLTSLAVAGASELLRRRVPVVHRCGEMRDAVILFLLLLFGNWMLYVLVPFNVSRSNSVLLVGYLNASGSTPRTEEEITTYVIDRYVNHYRAIPRRIAEQITLGNIVAVPGGYLLTDKGRLTVSLMSTLSSWYGIDNNFLEATPPDVAPDR